MTSRESKRVLETVLFLVLLNLFTNNIGAYSKGLNAFLGFSVLLVFFVLNFPTRLKPLSRVFYSIFIAVSMLAFIILDLDQLQLLIMLSAYLIMLLHLTSSIYEDAFELYTKLLTTVIYAGFFMLSEYSTFIWHVLQKISHYISITASTITQYKIDYSPTYCGLPIIITFVCFFISSALLGTKTKKNLYLQVIFLVLLIQLAYVLLDSFLMKFPFFNNGLGGRTAIDFHVIIFILMLFPLHLHLKSVSRAISFKGLPTLWIFPILGLLVFGSWFRLALAKEYRAPITKGRVLFFDGGYTDWNMPVFGKYGGEKGGMFGMLVRYLTSQNFEIAISGIDKLKLSKTDVLVLINLNRRFSEQENKLIWRFIGSGGSLLVLGDHTGKEIIRDPFNNLLSPVGIQFNFDSAVPRISKWKNAFKFMHHYINEQIHDETDLQIWIGASLSIEYPVRPVIIGKNAFSDSGNLMATQAGYLGDMRYTHGERLGDIVLVAEADYGKGTVLVFGDTSPFQNYALALSSGFVGRVFDYLINPEQKISYRLMPLSDISFLLALILFLSLEFWGRSSLLPFLSLSLAILFFNGVSLMKDTSNDLLKNGKIAIIDASHLERFSLDLWGDSNGCGGLVYNLVRNGFLPVIVKHLNSQHLFLAKMLVVIAPARPFNRFEIESLKTYVKNGGHLIISVSWQDRHAMQTLLDSLNLSIGNTPLGHVMPFQNDLGLTFDNAWPVIYDKESGTTVCTVWDYPAVAYTNYGDGGVLLVGDSSFFLNKNLEGLRNYIEPNVKFLREVISNYFK